MGFLRRNQRVRKSVSRATTRSSGENIERQTTTSLQRKRAESGQEGTQSVSKSEVSLFKYWLQRLGLLVLLLVITVAAVNVLALSSSPKLLPLNGSDSDNSFLRDISEYQAKAEQLFKESVFNQNKITVNTTKISQQMEKSFPELASVSVTLPLVAHRPIVYIEPAKPALILNAANGSYIVDTRGKALLRRSDKANADIAKLPVLTDQSGIKLALNKQALARDDVEFILTIISELQAKGLKVSRLTLPPASSELDAHIKNQPYFVKFNLQSGDARQQAGTYLATAAKLTRERTIPTLYIDVRVPGRAYYK